MALGAANDTGYIYFVLPFVTVMGALIIYAWRIGRNDKAAAGAYAALHSPSVTHARNAFDRRVALAVRQAKRGFVECTGCGFASAERAASCVLCGIALRRGDAEGRRKWWQSWGHGKPTNTRPVTTIGITARQLRIRTRRDWVRQIDAHGRAVWHTSCSASVPSYVLHSSTCDPLSSPTHDTGEAIDQSEDSLEVVVETVSAPETVIADVTRALENAVSHTKVNVVDATMADATHVVHASTGSGKANILDGIRSSQLDFPSKLAQFITSMASRFGSTNEADKTTVSRFMISRETLLADSLTALATMSPTAASAAIRVEFAGEQGIDAGGVYREWFFLLNEAIIQPTAGIFTCVDQQDQTFYLNPHSQAILGEHHLAHVFATGRLLGRALLEGNVTGFHLALPLLKIMLGLPVGFGDLQYFDPDMHKNLQWLLENDGAEHLGLDFTVTEKLSDGTVREVELIPGGSEVEVTDENKVEFVERKLKYHLIESVQDQLLAFLKGVYEVVPAELLVLFDAEELDYVLSGSDEIDVDDWERNTVTSFNLGFYPADELFWKVVRELSPDERRRLLQFSTGSTRVPPGGFSALTSNDGRLCLFSLRGVVAKETRGYLHSHACFNRVDLPMHKNVHDMRQAVLAAIAGETIGFTTD